MAANVIVVAGAGVSGLTSALLLSRNTANKITVVAKHMPGDYDIEYASPWAGANVLPMADDENSRWERRTWPELKRLTEEVPEAGIHFQKARVYRRQIDEIAPGFHPSDPLFHANPWFKSVLPDYRELSQEEVIPDHDSGCEFTSVCINTAIYLPWLVGQCVKNGVVFKRAVLSDIWDARVLSHTGQPPNIIINATALGSFKLGGVEDKAMIPARGQVVVVRNECTPMVATSGTDDGEAEMAYIMQRAAGGGTILGGTYDMGNWESTPDPNIAIRIMKRAVQVAPELTGGKGVEGLSIIRHGVGLRPYRKGGAVLEADKRVYAISGALLHTQLFHTLHMAPACLPTMASLIKFASDVANGRSALSKLIPLGLFLADAVLCGLVIWKVPYTEIDWTAYMEQVTQFVNGERDYPKMEGGTGPLVYPAAHVYIYTGLYHLTNKGTDIFLAQQLFAVLYMATLGVVMLSYWKAKVPPYIFPLLILSKRLHSVFVLRCFNDCFAALFLWLCIYSFQNRAWTLGALAYTLGLGVKMSLLLVLPAVIIILFLGRGFKGALRLVWLMAQVQIVLAIPFLTTNWAGYLGRAFELSRQFKFEWTVNWRMMGEETFLSRGFSITLLSFHVITLLVFIVARWLKLQEQTLLRIITYVVQFQSPFTEKEEAKISNNVVTPRYVLTTILSANVIGLLFARSLHYQFYAYLAWTTPFLLWTACPNLLVVVPLWLAQEWAWNVFPSTPLSSSVAVSVLAITVAMAFVGSKTSPTLYKPKGTAKPKQL
ncbi:ALG3 domain-containing protein [Trichoderma evansii]